MRGHTPAGRREALRRRDQERAGVQGRAIRAALRFFRWPPTELADGFGREAALPARTSCPSWIHPSFAVGPRLTQEGDSAASTSDSSVEDVTTGADGERR